MLKTPLVSDKYTAIQRKNERYNKLFIRSYLNLISFSSPSLSLFMLSILFLAFFIVSSQYLFILSSFQPPSLLSLYSYHSPPTLFSPLTRTYSANAAVIAEDELLCGTYIAVICPYVCVLSFVTSSHQSLKVLSIIPIFIFLRACHPLLTFAFTRLPPSPYLLSLFLPPPLFPSPSHSLPTYTTSASSINTKHAHTSLSD